MATPTLAEAMVKIGFNLDKKSAINQSRSLVSNMRRIFATGAFATAIKSSLNKYMLSTDKGSYQLQMRLAGLRKSWDQFLARVGGVIAQSKILSKVIDGLRKFLDSLSTDKIKAILNIAGWSAVLFVIIKITSQIATWSKIIKEVAAAMGLINIASGVGGGGKDVVKKAERRALGRSIAGSAGGTAITGVAGYMALFKREVLMSIFAFKSITSASKATSYALKQIFSVFKILFNKMKNEGGKTYIINQKTKEVKQIKGIIDLFKAIRGMKIFTTELEKLAKYPNATVGRNAKGQFTKLPTASKEISLGAARVSKFFGRLEFIGKWFNILFFALAPVVAILRVFGKDLKDLGKWSWQFIQILGWGLDMISTAVGLLFEGIVSGLQVFLTILKTIAESMFGGGKDLKTKVGEYIKFILNPTGAIANKISGIDGGNAIGDKISNDLTDIFDKLGFNFIKEGNRLGKNLSKIFYPEKKEEDLKWRAQSIGSTSFAGLSKAAQDMMNIDIQKMATEANTAATKANTEALFKVGTWLSEKGAEAINNTYTSNTNNTANYLNKQNATSNFSNPYDNAVGINNLFLGAVGGILR